MAQTPKSPDFVSKEAILLEARLESPPSRPADEPSAVHFQKEVDMRESLAESLVLPRESLYDRPPTPPPKDPPKRIQATPNVSRPGTSQTAPTQQEKPYQWQQPVASEPANVDRRHSTATSGEIKISVTASMLSGQLAGKGPKPNPMFAMHPLAMSPPSPIPSAIPKMPRRPARPASLRLSSSISNHTGLTSDKIVRVDSSRPGTSQSQSSQPHTGLTDTTRGFRTKYGRGKYATTELVPQPSDDGDDPLNWPTWRKQLNFYSILTTVAMVNVMKTALISVNAVLASQLSCSYVAAVALTGVPLMLSAGTGVAAVAVSRVRGRRPVYLVSMVLIFIGLVWNSQVSTNYGQFLGARILQGLGWGAFETLMPGTILDTYFQHERPRQMGVYRIISAATLWGAPLLSGLTAQNQPGPSLIFAILAVFQVVSIPLLVLGAPESMYDRLAAPGEKTTPGWSPRTGWSSLGLQSSSRYAGRLPAWARGRGLTLDRVLQYIKAVARPQSYAAPGTQDSGGGLLEVLGSLETRALLQQPFRALVAPTTLLAFVAAFLPHALLWGFSFSLSGLFARPPFQLLPATVGSLLATAFLFSPLVAGIFSFWPAWARTPLASAFQNTRRPHHLVLGAGTFLSFIGLLAFGLYVGAHVPAMTATVPQADAANAPDFRFAALSFILGLLAAGAALLAAPTAPLILRSTQFTSPNLAVALRNVADMEAAVACWQTLAAGVFVMGIPAATVTVTSAAGGLRSTGIGVAVVQVLVVVGVAAVWYLFEEDVWRWDGRVLRCIDLRSVKGGRSYFELDD